MLLTSGYGEENKTVRVVCSIMDTSSTGYKSGYSYEYFQRLHILQAGNMNMFMQIFQLPLKC